jgi:hypothetical protein
MIRTHHRDDRGSLPLAMLLVVVGLGLSGLLAATVNAQISSARATAQRADTLDAAQTGIQVGLGHLRAAAGDPSKLQCGPWTAALSGGTKQSYTVNLYYLTARPPAGDVTWASARKLPCTSAYLPVGGNPRYVMLESIGTIVTGQRGRTVIATYPLRSATRDNNGGGLIHLFGPTTPDLCFAAPSTTPAAGAALTMQVCDNGSAAQRFAYTPDLTLALVGTRDDGSAGMCLDAAPANGTAVQFQTCTTLAQQKWGYNDAHNFEGIDSGGSLNSICFHLTAPGTAGSAVLLSAKASDPVGVSEQDRSCGGTFTTSRTFVPDASVGAGRAATAQELVSFGQYSSCVASNANVELVPCQQRASSADASFTWTLPAGAATGALIKTTGTDGLAYCLTSPGAPAANRYVSVSLCTATPTTAMKWNRVVATGVYPTAYRIESSYDAAAGVTYCLSPATAPDAFLSVGVTRLVMATCSGSPLQKWNAPASMLSAPLIDVAEN